MMETRGMVFNIQHFSLHDGPGIRTIVFLKGCPLRCLWCHNPEGRSNKRQLLYYEDKCLQCGACAQTCPQGVHRFDGETHLIEREHCAACGRCAEVCPAQALTIAGEEKSVSEVMEEVMRDEVFYKRTGGGITLSGGEPLMQEDFAAALLREAKKHELHTCVETSGFASQNVIRKVLPYLDAALFDVKELQDELHKQWTGVSDRIILENLKTMDKYGTKLYLRCPIVPGCNDREEHYRAVARLANTLQSIVRVELLMYHPFGVTKSEALGMRADYTNTEFLSKEVGKEVAEKMKQITRIPVIVS